MSELMMPDVKKLSDLNYQTSFGDDSKLHVEFFDEPMLMEFKSEEAQRAIYEPVTMIRIYSPGQPAPKIFKAQLTDLPNKKADSKRWPAAWESFKNKSVVVHEGHPIDMWAPLSATDALNLKARNIHTVEQLAAVPDTMLEAPGFLNRQLRDKAVVYIKSQGDGSLAMKLQAKLETQDQTIAELKKTIDELKNLTNQEQRKKA